MTLRRLTTPDRPDRPASTSAPARQGSSSTAARLSPWPGTPYPSRVARSVPAAAGRALTAASAGRSRRIGAGSLALLPMLATVPAGLASAEGTRARRAGPPAPRRRRPRDEDATRDATADAAAAARCCLAAHRRGGVPARYGAPSCSPGSTPRSTSPSAPTTRCCPWSPVTRSLLPTSVRLPVRSDALRLGRRPRRHRARRRLLAAPGRPRGAGRAAVAPQPGHPGPGTRARRTVWPASPSGSPTAAAGAAAPRGRAGGRAGPSLTSRSAAVVRAALSGSATSSTPACTSSWGPAPA